MTERIRMNAKLATMALLAMGLVAVAVYSGVSGVNRVERDLGEVAGDGEALFLTARIELWTDGLHTNVYQALHAAGSGALDKKQEILADTGRDARELRGALVKAEKLLGDGALKARLDALASGLRRHADETSGLVSLAFEDKGAAMARLPGFEREARSVSEEIDAFMVVVKASAGQSHAMANQITERTRSLMTWTGVLAAIVLLAFSVLVVRRLLAQLAASHARPSGSPGASSGATTP